MIANEECSWCDEGPAIVQRGRQDAAENRAVSFSLLTSTLNIEQRFFAGVSLSSQNALLPVLVTSWLDAVFSSRRLFAPVVDAANVPGLKRAALVSMTAT